MSNLLTRFPVEARRVGRYGIGLVRDVFERGTGHRDRMLPPHRLRFVGHGDFKLIGEETVRQLVDLAGLQPDQDILDIGCGVGRVAIPLSTYLSPDGSYSGFDIVPKAIQWCRDNISVNNANFSFHQVDLRNTRYRRTYGTDAASFRFEYPDDTFDLAFASSVFTHLLPGAMANYLREIARVLRPEGTSFTTWFLLNSDVRDRLRNRKGPLTFRWDYGDYAVDDKRVPEAVTAYDEILVRREFVEAGLRIQEPIDFSSWSGGRSSRPGQDIIVARKDRFPEKPPNP